MESKVEELPASYQIGSVLFETDELKLALVEECKAWKRAYGGALNLKAGKAQDDIFDFCESYTQKLRLVILALINFICPVPLTYERKS